MKLFTSALAILSLVHTSTFAAGTIYPGAMGVRWSANEPVPSLSSSMIQNPSSTQWLRVDLPAVHQGSGMILSSWVKVLDRSYNQNVRCSLHSVVRGSGSFYGFHSPNRYSNGSSTGPQTLSFTPLGSSSTSHYYFSCHIPPRYSGNMSGIISYFVFEL